MAQITDENDNLQYTPGEDQKKGDKWITTPGGNCKMNLDLEEDIVEDLISYWARNNLHSASLEQYEEVLAAEGQEAAIYSAILNEVIIDALTAKIERVEAEAKDAAKDV